jgi:hypothetical protein
MCYDVDVRIECAQPCGSGIDLRPPDGIRVVQHLALQIAELHVVRVDDTDLSHTRRGEIEGSR